MLHYLNLYDNTKQLLVSQAYHLVPSVSTAPSRAHMSVTNWCSTCETQVDDHPSMCTICGESLIAPPQIENERPSRALAAYTINDTMQGDGEWQTPTAEAMDPSTADTSSRRSNGASHAFLQQLVPRTLHSQSSMFYSAQVKVYFPEPLI